MNKWINANKCLQFHQQNLWIFPLTSPVYLFIIFILTISNGSFSLALNRIKTPKEGQYWADCWHSSAHSVIPRWQRNVRHHLSIATFFRTISQPDKYFPTNKDSSGVTKKWTILNIKVKKKCTEYTEHLSKNGSLFCLAQHVWIHAKSTPYTKNY